MKDIGPCHICAKKGPPFFFFFLTLLLKHFSVTHI